MEEITSSSPPVENTFFGVLGRAAEKTGVMDIINKFSIALLQVQDLSVGLDAGGSAFLGALRTTNRYLGGTSILKAPWDVINITEALQQGNSVVCRIGNFLSNLGDSVFSAIGFYEILSKTSVVGEKLGSINFFGNTLSLTAYTVADLALCLSFVFDSVDMSIGLYKAFGEKGMKAITELKMNDIFNSKVAWKLLANALRIAILTSVFLGFGISYLWFVTLKVFLGLVNIRNLKVALTERKQLEAENVQNLKVRTSKLEAISVKC